MIVSDRYYGDWSRESFMAGRSITRDEVWDLPCAAFLSIGRYTMDKTPRIYFTPNGCNHFSVSLCDNPKVLQGDCLYSEEEMKPIYDWIKWTYPVLLVWWEGHLENDLCDVFNILKTLRDIKDELKREEYLRNVIPYIHADWVERKSCYI